MPAAPENELREFAWDFIIHEAQQALDDLLSSGDERRPAIQKRIDMLRNIRKNYFIMNLLEETDNEGR